MTETRGSAVPPTVLWDRHNTAAQRLFARNLAERWSALPATDRRLDTAQQVTGIHADDLLDYLLGLKEPDLAHLILLADYVGCRPIALWPTAGETAQFVKHDPNQTLPVRLVAAQQIDLEAIEYFNIAAHCIGVIERAGQPDILCYDKAGVLKQFARDMGGEDEAVSFFYNNTVGTWAGEHTPCFLTAYATPTIHNIDDV